MRSATPRPPSARQVEWRSVRRPSEEPVGGLPDQDGAAQQEHQHPPGVQVGPGDRDEGQADEPAAARVDQVAPQHPDDGRGEHEIDHLDAHAQDRAGQHQAKAQPHDAARPADLRDAQGDGSPQDPEGKHGQAAEQEGEPRSSPRAEVIAQRQDDVGQPVLADPGPTEGDDAPGIGAGDGPGAQHLLAGADVPPHVAVGQRRGRSRQHGGQEEANDGGRGGGNASRRRTGAGSWTLHLAAESKVVRPSDLGYFSLMSVHRRTD